HRAGRRPEQLQPAARMGPEGRPGAREAGHLAEPREPHDVGIRRQRDGPLCAVLHLGAGVPQPEAALRCHRPARGRVVGPRAIDVVVGVLQNAQPTGAPMNRENFILMTVGGLTLDPVTKTPIVILRDPDNKLNLPIWIGLLEATAMATE